MIIDLTSGRDGLPAAAATRTQSKQSCRCRQETMSKRSCPNCGHDVSSVIAQAASADAAKRGSITSRAKAQAAKDNGKKGGRPRNDNSTRPRN